MRFICPDCGTQYESGKFCQECGAKLQEFVPELVCPSCGYKAKSGKFCPECGTKLTEQILSTQTTVIAEESKRMFNERDPRFAKYYDEKGLPRAVPQEELDVAKEELTPYVRQGIAEAKMLLASILIDECKKGKEKDVWLKSEVVPASNELHIPEGAISLSSMDEIREGALTTCYPTESQKVIAIAVYKIAEVIQERLPKADVSYLVNPSELDSSVDEDALPIHFLFKKNGSPKVAVVAVTENGYKAFSVRKTQDWCASNGIEYVRVYANGCYADWITGWSKMHNAPVTPQAVEFCKNWLVEKIRKHL